MRTLIAITAYVLTLAFVAPTRAENMLTDASNAVLPDAKNNLHLILNVDDYGAIGDGNSHPLSGFFATEALAAAHCPSLNFLAGTTHTGNTNSSTSLTSVASLIPYVVIGQTVTDTLGDIPANTTVTAVNYSTGVVTISLAATGTHIGDSLTFGLGVNWATVEMDWCGIDVALWAARASATGVLYSLPIAFNPKNYGLNYPINLTCFSSPTATGNSCATQGDFGPTVIYGNGASILGGFSSDPGSNALDLLGSSQIIIHDLTIFAQDSIGFCAGSELKRGIQIGLPNPGMSSDRHHFDNVFVQGCFTQAPLYNEASENFYNERSQYENGDGSGSAYLGIWDGGNHFGVTSDYVNVTVPTNSPQTFNTDTEVHTFYVPWAAAPSAGSGFFIYGTIGQDISGAYVAVPANSTGPCITLYNDNSGLYGGFAQNLHANNFACESQNAAGAPETFSIVSKTAGATPTLKGLDYSTIDDPASSTGSIFALGANTSALSLQNAQVRIANFFHAPNFLDNAANYTITGADIRLPTGFGGDNIASGWTGIKCVGAACAGTAAPPPYTWATRPAASSPLTILVTDVGKNGCLFRSDGSYWKPLGTCVLLNTAAPATTTGTTEQILAQVPLPANILGTTGALKVYSIWTTTSNTDTKIVDQLRWGTLGTTSDPVVAGGAYVINTVKEQASFREEIWNNGTLSAQSSASGNYGNGSQSTSQYNGVAGTVNTGVQTYLSFSATAATSPDTATLAHLRVELLP